MIRYLLRIIPPNIFNAQFFEAGCFIDQLTQTVLKFELNELKLRISDDGSFEKCKLNIHTNA